MDFNHKCTSLSILTVVAALVVLVLCTPPLAAQSLLTGDVSGTITDPSGAVLVNAAVTLKSLDRGETQTTTTNSSGFYRFSLLKPGAYNVTVTQTGFRKAETKVTVAVGQVTATNIVLQMGQTSELVEVTGAAAVVNTDNANVASSFEPRIVLNTPNPGGDLTNIAQMAPGVTMNTSGGYGNLTANGLPGTANLFTVNGENDMDPFFNINNSGATNLTLGINEIQEATVTTNPYSGQYGQQAGAQVTYITKSGTNTFHGSLRYDWNGRLLNANDWFGNHTVPKTPRPFANGNQWGADFGGPIFKDKTFFYVDTEGLRYTLPTVQNTYVVTPLYANAVLANLTTNYPAELPLYTQLFKVWTNAPGAASGTPVPSSCPTGTSPIFGVTLPFSATDSCMTNFIATPNSHSSEWILAGRVDQNFDNNDKVFFRYRMDRGLQATYTDPVNAAFNATSSQPAYDGQINWTRVLTPKMTNQFLLTGSWYSAPFLQDEAKVAATFPFDMTFAGGASPLTNFARLRSFPQGRSITQYQFIDDYIVMRGDHSLKFGANFRRYDVSDHNFFYRHPRLSITDLGLFFDGFATYTRQDFGPQSVVAPIAMYGLGVYAQDEWRVRPSFKLSLALRAERNSNPTCRNNCFSRFSNSFLDLTHGATIPYDQSIRSHLSQPYSGIDAISMSPRVGFSWSPFGNNKTVLSGGVGLFYDALSQGIVEGSFQDPPGWVDYRVPNSAWADPTSAGALAQLQAISAAFQAGFPAGASYASLKASYPFFRPPIFSNYAGTVHTPQYQEWNFQVQHAFGNNMSLMVNYFGSHAIHIPIENSGLEAYDPDNLLNGALPATKLDPSFNEVLEWSTVGVANSNGLDVTFTRRFSRGLSFQANYTWAHALDEVSNGGAFVYGGDSFISQLNPFNLRANNYGNADYDIRHNFNSNLLWQPSYKPASKILNGFLGGWSFSGSLFARTGLPYMILDSNTVGYFGYANIYAGAYFAVPGQPIGPGPNPGQQSCINGNSQCFNIASFVDAGAATFTSYGGFPTQRRNQYRGPNFFDTNFNVVKNFNLTERVKFGIGANFYNVFNHPNFANPNYVLADGDPTVGKILSTVSVPASPYGSFVGAAAAPRLVQLEGRLTF
jgi:hypothetical protein